MRLLGEPLLGETARHNLYPENRALMMCGAWFRCNLRGPRCKIESHRDGDMCSGLQHNLANLCKREKMSASESFCRIEAARETLTHAPTDDRAVIMIGAIPRLCVHASRRYIAYVRGPGGKCQEKDHEFVEHELRRRACDIKRRITEGKIVSNNNMRKRGKVTQGV